jgi:hypothetical protein
MAFLGDFGFIPKPSRTTRRAFLLRPLIEGISVLQGAFQNNVEDFLDALFNYGGLYKSRQSRILIAR